MGRVKAITWFLWDTWIQLNASFWTAVHGMSQGSVTASEERPICPLPHTWPHRRSWLARVTVAPSGSPRSSSCFAISRTGLPQILNKVHHISIGSYWIGSDRDRSIIKYRNHCLMKLRNCVISCVSLRFTPVLPANSSDFIHRKTFTGDVRWIQIPESRNGHRVWRG